MSASTNDTRRFETRVIHSGQESLSWEGATLPPISRTASHLHPTAESLSRAAPVDTRNQEKTGKTIKPLPILGAPYGIFQIRSRPRLERL